MYLEAGLLLLGMICLVQGAEFFVKAAAFVARKFGVSDFVIGLTLVAVGTSLPELMASIVAITESAPNLVMGNITGSNIANIGLILGLSAAIYGLNTQPQILKRDGYIMGLVSLIFFVFAFNGTISFFEGIVLFMLYVSYIFFLLDEANQNQEKKFLEKYIWYFVQFKFQKEIALRIRQFFQGVFHHSTPLRKIMIDRDLVINSLKLILGLLGLIIGADLVVKEALFFAEFFEVPDYLVGLTLLALGTSLPEIAVSLNAARNNHGEIAIGNVIGSNIANILLIIGVTGTISPFEVSDYTINFTLPVMLIFGFGMLIFIRTKWQISRFEGILMLLGYIIFLAFSFAYH